MHFSLLLATVGRTAQLRQLLESLAIQSWRDFDLIVVDQNADDRLAGILADYEGKFPIERLRSARGHSRAFNLGLRHATGEVTGFPDDDCWYDPDLLERAAFFFEQNPGWEGLTGREVVQPGFTSGGRWDRRAGRVTPGNVWRRAITFSIFLRRSLLEHLRFDETLGVGAGSPWGAGEETDLLLRAIERGHAIYYDPSLRIWHQGRSGPYTAEVYSKAGDYGRGMGRVLRQHRTPLHLVANHLIRPLGGALLALGAGRPEKARCHWCTFAGRLGGWLAKPEEHRARRTAPLVSGEQANLP
jgi:glycosyltransferase involved in cell wall biosynthesis